MQALTQLAEPKVHRAPPLGFEHRPWEEGMQLQRQQLLGPASAIPVRLFSGSGEAGEVQVAVAKLLCFVKRHLLPLN